MAQFNVVVKDGKKYEIFIYGGKRKHPTQQSGIYRDNDTYDGIVIVAGYGLQCVYQLKKQTE